MLWLWRATNKNDGYEKDLRIEIKSERGKVLQFPLLSEGGLTPFLYTTTGWHISKLNTKNTNNIPFKILSF